MAHTTTFSAALLALTCTLGSAAFPIAAEASSRSFRATVADVKLLCGGTFLGTNKDGYYGCVNKINVITCKKGKCWLDTTRVAPTGGGDHGKQTSGNDGGRQPKGGNQGGNNVNTGNANMNNAGMQSGGGGNVIN